MKQMNVRAADKKINTKGTMGRLFRFMKPYRIRIILMVACLVMGAVFTTQGPYTLGRAYWMRWWPWLWAAAGVLQGFRTFITVLIQLGCVYVLAFLFNLFRPVHCRQEWRSRTMHDLRMVSRQENPPSASGLF